MFAAIFVCGFCLKRNSKSSRETGLNSIDGAKNPAKNGRDAAAGENATGAAMSSATAVNEQNRHAAATMAAAVCREAGEERPQNTKV